MALPATTTTQHSDDDNSEIGLWGLAGLLRPTKKVHTDRGYYTGAGDPNRLGR